MTVMATPNGNKKLGTHLVFQTEVHFLFGLKPMENTEGYRRDDSGPFIPLFHMEFHEKTALNFHDIFSMVSECRKSEILDCPEIEIT